MAATAGMAFPLGGGGGDVTEQTRQFPSPFGAPSLDQLTALVFELASQLHVEARSWLSLWKPRWRRPA